MDKATENIVELASKMDALGLWPVVGAYHWALKPKGCAIPYFTCVAKDAPGTGVRHRLLLLEGWQTFHDFVRVRADHDYGFILSPLELAHYELVFPENGQNYILVRNDPGYAPALATARQCEFVEPMLWQCYGVMLRIEADRSLALKFAGEKSVFARIQEESGEWVDAPLTIPAARPHTEEIMLFRDVLAKAKDLPMAADEVVDVVFEILLGVETRDPRPRLVYHLLGTNAKSGEIVFEERFSVNPEYGLRGMWETLPGRVLQSLARTGRIPGEVRVCSGRLFRVLRHLCNEIPFRLSMHDKLERLQQ